MQIILNTAGVSIKDWCFTCKMVKFSKTLFIMYFSGRCLSLWMKLIIYSHMGERWIRYKHFPPSTRAYSVCKYNKARSDTRNTSAFQSIKGSSHWPPPFPPLASRKSRLWLRRWWSCSPSCCTDCWRRRRSPVHPEDRCCSDPPEREKQTYCGASEATRLTEHHLRNHSYWLQ